MKRMKIGSTAWSILCGYSVIIVLLIALGITAYEQAAAGMRANYEQAEAKSLKATTAYVELAMQSVENEVNKYVNDMELNAYTAGSISDVTKVVSLLSGIKKQTAASVTANKYISNIYIIPKKEYNAMSTVRNADKGFFEAITESEDAKGLENGSGIWKGYHKEMDSQLEMKSGTYIASYLKEAGNFSSKNMLVAADFDYDAMASILEGMNSNREITGFVTSDSRELSIAGSDMENAYIDLFLNENYGTGDGEEIQKRYVTYQNERYLLLLSPIGKTGTYLYHMMPDQQIKSQVFTMKVVIITFNVIAVLAALFLAGRIAKKISESIIESKEVSKRVSLGDLTGKMKQAGKGDFAQLADSINGITQSMRVIVSDTAVVSGEITGSSSELDNAYVQLFDSSQNITGAMGDIVAGNAQQAQEMQNCLATVEDLSDTLVTIHGQLQDTQGIAKEAKETVRITSDSVIQLDTQTEQTTAIVKTVAEEMSILNADSVEIKKIAEGITEISEQTNVLSLNARIEAARAGTYGAGFSVISQQINELSNKTLTLAAQIGTIVHRIEQHTADVETALQETYGSQQQQTEIVKAVYGAFETIRNSMDRLFANVSQVNGQVGEIEEIRKATLEIVQNTAAVSQQIMASSDTVQTSVTHQGENVEKLKAVSETLTYNAEKLKNLMQRYKM